MLVGITWGTVVPQTNPALTAAAQPSHCCRLQPHTLQSGRAG